MEEAQNPQVNPNHTDNSHDYGDDYNEVENTLKNQKKSNSQNYAPENPIETAHMLLGDSDLTENMPEIDKEIKLANLDFMEKRLTYQFLSIWRDLIWQREQQQKKVMEGEALGRISTQTNDAIVENIYNQFHHKYGQPAVFDSVGAIRSGILIPTLSRGKFGFEREMQVRTITDYNVNQQDPTETNPGFMSKIARFAGGFKR